MLGVTRSIAAAVSARVGMPMLSAGVSTGSSIPPIGSPPLAEKRSSSARIASCEVGAGGRASTAADASSSRGRSSTGAGALSLRALCVSGGVRAATSSGRGAGGVVAGTATSSARGAGVVRAVVSGAAASSARGAGVVRAVAAGGPSPRALAAVSANGFSGGAAARSCARAGTDITEIERATESASRVRRDTAIPPRGHEATEVP